MLLAAEWSKALFDVAQMRTIRYPLSRREHRRRDRQGSVGRRSRGRSTPWARRLRPSSRRSRDIRRLRESGGRIDHEGRDGSDSRSSRGRSAPCEPLQKAAAWWRPKGWRKQWINARTGPTDAIALIRLVRDCADSKEDWGSWPASSTGCRRISPRSKRSGRSYAFALANSGNTDGCDCET